MNLDLHALMESAYSPRGMVIEGHWQAIQLRPDFASEELLNIGVTFSDGKSRSFRLLSNFDKFAHIYGEVAEDELKLVLSAVRSSVLSETLETVLPCVQLTPPRLARGQSLQEIVDRIFPALVTLDGPVHTAHRTRARFLNNTQVREQVFRSLRVQGGLFADRLIAQEEAFMCGDKGNSHALDVPIRYGSHFGSVVSAAFAKWENVEKALLRASMDLVAARAISISSDAELFVLRPCGLVPSDHQRRIDNIIDTTNWKLQKVGVGLEVADSPEGLATDILTWAETHVRKLVASSGVGAQYAGSEEGN